MSTVPPPVPTSPKPNTAHASVMLAEVIEGLAVKDGGVYVDGTFGRGGYTKRILEAARTHVVAIDRDPAAIACGRAMESDYASRIQIMHGTFGDMKRLVTEAGHQSVDGITLDLGVSSPQLDEASRGFSFQKDGPLDMRMSASGRSAADVVNEMSEKDLANIIYVYGEERYSRRIANRIVHARASTPITTTFQLADIVRSTVPRSADGIDPATRTFQALRIEVNDELGELERALEASIALLKPSGRLAVVSFHSLEDRAVKIFVRDHSDEAPRASRHAPVDPFSESRALFRLLTKKPILPTPQEIETNPRARSARLRVVERTDLSPQKEYAA